MPAAYKFQGDVFRGIMCVFPPFFVHLLTAFEMTKVSNSEFSGIMPSL